MTFDPVLDGVGGEEMPQRMHGELFQPGALASQLHRATRGGDFKNPAAQVGWVVSGNQAHEQISQVGKMRDDALLMIFRPQFSWTQDALAKYLRRMGWNISRSTLAKVEARLVLVTDSDLLYFVRLFEVEPSYLLPELDPEEHLGTAVQRLLARGQGRRGHLLAPQREVG